MISGTHDIMTYHNEVQHQHKTSPKINTSPYTPPQVVFLFTFVTQIFLIAAMQSLVPFFMLPILHVLSNKFAAIALTTFLIFSAI